MENFDRKTCSNCGSSKFKAWGDLSDDDKFVIERLPNREHSNEERKKQHYCERCLYNSNDCGVTSS